MNTLRILFARMICAWCDADLGPSDTELDSHGICEPCRRRHFGK